MTDRGLRVVCHAVRRSGRGQCPTAATTSAAAVARNRARNQALVQGPLVDGGMARIASAGARYRRHRSAARQHAADRCR